MLKRHTRRGLEWLRNLEAIGFQTVVSLLVVLCIVMADLGALALSWHPSSEILWRFNLDFGNLFLPLLRLIDGAYGLGFAGNMCIFGACTAILLLAYRLRFRLVSAVLCHLFFVLFVVTTLTSFQGREYATLMQSGYEITRLMTALSAEPQFLMMSAILVALSLICLQTHLVCLVRICVRIRRRII